MWRCGTILFNVAVAISVSTKNEPSCTPMEESMDDTLLLKLLQSNVDASLMLNTLQSKNSKCDENKITPTASNGKNNSPNLLPNHDQCGQSASVFQIRIAGGMDAGLGKFPWMALIGYAQPDDGGKPGPVQFGCGGTLINSNHVLTAAHCVSGLPAGYYPTMVRLGEYNTSSPVDCVGKICAPPPQDIRIEITIPHEEYDRTLHKENDIAIVKLERNAVLGDFVSPVCLPRDKTYQSLPGAVLTVAGWGRTTSGNPDNSPVLQMVVLPFQPKDKCRKYYGDFMNSDVGEERFCSGGISGKDSCKGDSGGPIMINMNKSTTKPSRPRMIQVGLVSLGPKGCENSVFPGLYTNVSYYMDWILENVK